MTYSDAGIALTKQFEGLKLTAYRDSAGVWTIGYGHAGVREGETITEDQANELLRMDVAYAVRKVNELITCELAQNEFDALVDFTFNLGGGALFESTLRRRLNAGDKKAAAEEFDRWIYAGGEVNKGLVRRRAAERAMFEGRQ